MIPSGKTLYECLTDYAAARPEKKLLGDSRRWLSVADSLRMARSAALRFRAQGIGVGDLVALRAERSIDTIIALLGLRFVGAVVVLTDPRHEAEEVLAHCAVPIPVKAVFDGAACPASNIEASFAAAEVSSQAPAFILFTSGSTGKSKAVVLSEYNLVNNLVDSQPLGDYSEDDIALGALPLDHVFGLVLLAGTMVLRYALYLPDRTDIPSILGAIEKQKLTRMNGVPSLYLAMAEQRSDYDLSSLRAGFIGGGPVTKEQFRRIERDLDMTLISVYGMSECIGISCSSFRDGQDVRACGVGPFYSMNTGKVLLEDGSEAVPGQEGEICVKGPARMLGYYGEKMPEDEFLHTGDLGYLDAGGVLHITGRKKDIIIRNGLNLSPKKIEDALLSLPGVKAAAVVGLPDERQGEVPYALVAGMAEVSQLAALLQKNELPVGILEAGTLPLTASGKPDKQRIREVLTAWRNG